MIVASTFSKKGYDIYGKKWVESVLKFWPANTQIHLYIDFKINNLPNNFRIMPFYTACNHHEDFQQKVTNYYNSDNSKTVDIRNKVIKFSHKAFVINYELHNPKSKYFVWLDGDVETISKISFADIEGIIKGNFLGCQREKQKHKYPHIESGILIFNLLHQNTDKFKELFNIYYTTNKLFTVKKPYDGYIIGKILKDLELDFYDFNENFLVTSKQSSKDDTFLHPFLKERFIHWIGNDKKNT